MPRLWRGVSLFPEFFAPSDSAYPITATARWIGNAVPVELARAIARSVRGAIEATQEV